MQRNHPAALMACPRALARRRPSLYTALMTAGRGVMRVIFETDDDSINVKL